MNSTLGAPSAAVTAATAALTSSFVGDVGEGKHGRAARCFDLGHDGTPRLLVAVDDADLGALGREKLRRGASHAGCAARDQGDLACQSAGHGAFILLLRDGRLF